VSLELIQRQVQTEIAILADSSAIAADVAADLISQAEHDVIAAAVLVTRFTRTSQCALKQSSRCELQPRMHSERIKTALSGVQSAIALVDDIEQGLDVVNAYAAEHLRNSNKAMLDRDADKDS